MDHLEKGAKLRKPKESDSEDKINWEERMMNKCETCKYWSTKDYRLNFDNDGYGICRLLTSYDNDDIVSDLAEASCFSEGIGGDFMTKPNFGCILHEKVLKETS